MISQAMGYRFWYGNADAIITVKQIIDYNTIGIAKVQPM